MDIFAEHTHTTCSQKISTYSNGQWTVEEHKRRYSIAEIWCHWYDRKIWRHACHAVQTVSMLLHVCVYSVPNWKLRMRLRILFTFWFQSLNKDIHTRNTTLPLFWARHVSNRAKQQASGYIELLINSTYCKDAHRCCCCCRSTLLLC
jgi:hypothetical protein